VLAIALASKLARIAWSVLAHGQNFEAGRVQTLVTQRSDRDLSANQNARALIS
jgi:hypothetical protein